MDRPWLQSLLMCLGIFCLPLSSGCRGKTGIGKGDTPSRTAAKGKVSFPEVKAHGQEKELFAYLQSTRFFGMLGGPLGKSEVKRVVIVESSEDRVVIAAEGSEKPIGEVYYTIQDGWHLRLPNETMTHRPGEGWVIGEQ